MRNDANSPWRELMQWGPDETFGGVFGFTPDNRKLWVATSLDANAARLLEVDIETGAQTVIAADPQFDISGIELQPKTDKLQAARFVKQRVSYEFLDPSLKGDFELLQKVQPRRHRRSLANSRRSEVGSSATRATTHRFAGSSTIVPRNRPHCCSAPDPTWRTTKLSNMQPISTPHAMA